MRPIDKIRQKVRFEMFNESSKLKVLEINTFFDKYIMHYEDKIKKTFIYYDTPDEDLRKSNIVLFKTQIDNFTELTMSTEKVSTSVRYRLRTNEKTYKKAIKPHDNLLKHKEFLMNSFKDMFLSSLNFDPEFFLRKLKPVYTINTTSEEYRSLNVTGLKITYSFDKDTYINHNSKSEVKDNILTIYQHSPEKTDEDFADLISKLTRYCKELTPTNETKIAIARRKTSGTNQKSVDKKELAKMKDKVVKDKKEKKKK